MQRINPKINMIKTTMKIIGMLLVMESSFMTLCSFASLFSNQTKAFWITLLSALITVLVGGGMWFWQRKQKVDIDKRCGFLIVTLVWFVFSLFGSLPSYLGGYIPKFIDAYFETMSGFTTTGCSILDDVESLPYSIGLWRTMTQWIGGIGIIVIMLSVISFAGGGGMSLFSAEVAGIDKSKTTPHIKETAKALILVYSGLTIFSFLTFVLLGMGVYDAVCHCFTVVATAGLSSKNASAAAFSTPIQYAMVFYMFLAACNLLYIYYVCKGNFKQVKKSEELRVYLGVILVATIIVFIFIYPLGLGIEQTFRNAFFMVVSILSSTNLVNCEYTLWPIGAIMILFMLMNSGAMSGSTTGGLKLVRMIVLFKNARNTLKQGMHSKSFLPVTIDHKMLSEQTMNNVFNVFILYIITLIVGSLLFVATGVSIEQALISSISALCNMGIGFGEQAYGDFSAFTDFAKLIMALMMCIGRLELVTVFAVFGKSFRNI